MPVLVILGYALLHVVTKPWIYILIFGWLFIAKFDFGLFGEELRATIWSLWPFLVLIIVLFFAVQAFGVAVSQRGKGNKK